MLNIRKLKSRYLYLIIILISLSSCKDNESKKDGLIVGNIQSWNYDLYPAPPSKRSLLSVTLLLENNTVKPLKISIGNSDNCVKMDIIDTSKNISEEIKYVSNNFLEKKHRTLIINPFKDTLFEIIIGDVGKKTPPLKGENIKAYLEKKRNEINFRFSSSYVRMYNDYIKDTILFKNHNAKIIFNSKDSIRFFNLLKQDSSITW